MGSRALGLFFLPLLLSGCPFSDDYFIDDMAGGGEGSSDLGMATSSRGDTTTGKATTMGTTTSTTSASTGTTDAGGNNGTGGDPTTSDSSGGSGGSGGVGGLESSGGSGGSGGVAGSGASESVGGSGGSGGVAGSGGVGGVGGLTGSGGVGGADCTPSDEICDGVDNDCNDAIDDGACPTNCAGFVIDGASYMYCGTLVSSLQIDTRCADQGMLPVHIDSAAENAALLEAVQPLDAELGQPNAQQRAFWIGASDSLMEGTWRWLDDDTIFWIGNGSGSAVDGLYNNWGFNRPNNASSSFSGEDCALMYVQMGMDGTVGEWNDVECIDDYAYVCELP